MAWKARIAGKRVEQSGHIRLIVEFFDDATPGTVLYEHMPSFAPGTTKAQAVAAIRAEGQRLRSAVGNVQAVLEQVTDGEEITIP